MCLRNQALAWWLYRQPFGIHGAQVILLKTQGYVKARCFPGNVSMDRNQTVCHPRLTWVSQMTNRGVVVWECSSAEPVCCWPSMCTLCRQTDGKTDRRATVWAAEEHSSSMTCIIHQGLHCWHLTLPGKLEERSWVAPAKEEPHPDLPPFFNH